MPDRRRLNIYIGEGTEAETLKVGQNVEGTYNLKVGKIVATKILVVK